MKVFILGLFVIITSSFIFSQDSSYTHTADGRKIIQLHGLVLEGDSLYGVPGVKVYDSKSGRGATTGLLGYFSFPAQEGDTITVRGLGIKSTDFVIPLLADSTYEYFKKVTVEGDSVLLSETCIGCLPEEHAFKQAVLAYSDPYDIDANNARKNLNDQIMARLLESSDMSANMNHAYFMQQQVAYIENRYMATDAPYLDPFAWNRFFKDLERDKQKKKEEQKKKNNIKPY